VGHDLAVDVRLPDPPGDQLRVLGPEVDDQDGVEGAQRSSSTAMIRRQRPIPMPWARWSVLPSVMRAGATMTSAFWNSFTVS
jgi:hypothetical protein